MVPLLFLHLLILHQIVSLIKVESVDVVILHHLLLPFLLLLLHHIHERHVFHSIVPEVMGHDVAHELGRTFSLVPLGSLLQALWRHLQGLVLAEGLHFALQQEPIVVAHDPVRAEQ